MTSERLNAFSDGVIAILITILVLELRIPHGTDFSALRDLLPVFLTYVLSFVFLAIYWNNHHHMLFLTDRVNGGILWANTHLLFWLSLVPFVTGWMGENHFAALPTALYGAVLMMAGVAYYVLEQMIIRSQGKGSRLGAAVGNDAKGRISVVMYLIAIPLAFVHQLLSDALYVAVALMWLVPDRRIETHINRMEKGSA
jgi:TMEM175 potassium channel family protein